MSGKGTKNNPDCVLLKDNNLALAARLGPEIYFRACLCVLQGPRHNTKCWFSIQHFILLLMFCLETPKKSSGPTNLWIKSSLASLSAISFPHIPRIPACPGTRCSTTVCRVEISFNAFWGCRTNGDIVLADKCFQRRLSISNTNVFVWPILSFNFMNAG
jgi:hypothetical protein